VGGWSWRREDGGGWGGDGGEMEMAMERGGSGASDVLVRVLPSPSIAVLSCSQGGDVDLRLMLRFPPKCLCRSPSPLRWPSPTMRYGPALNPSDACMMNVG
jgi:hypothetical protein